MRFSGETGTRDSADRSRHGAPFIVLEGIDGCGKSTQAARLVEWLRGRDIDPVACRDPGGTGLGDRLRHLLLDDTPDAPTIGLRAELLLYMASRAQLVDEVIRPALQSHRPVVSDRFLLSSFVYQGLLGGSEYDLEVDDLWGVGWTAVGGLLPDLTLILDVDPDRARERLGSPRDRIEARVASRRQALRTAFLRAAEDDRFARPLNIRVVPADQAIDAVAEAIQKEVTHVLGPDPGP